METFTQREIDVWKLTAQGFGLKEIGARLSLCEATVSQYRKTLYSKLGVDNAVRAALAAISCGIITPGVAPAPTMRIAFRAKNNVGCAAR